MEEEKNVEIHLGYEDQLNMFLITFVQGTNALFQFKMVPENFEKLTADMVKTVKNYNLYEAQKFQEKKDEVAQPEAIGSSEPGPDLSNPPCSDCQCEAQPEQPKSNS